MKKLIVLFALLFSINLLGQHDHAAHKKSDQKQELNPMIHTGEIDVKKLDENKDGKVFECPMDWNIISDKEGRCPVCEMKLKEYTVKDTEKNLIKFGHKVKGHIKADGKKEDDAKMKEPDNKQKGSKEGCKDNCCK